MNASIADKGWCEEVQATERKYIAFNYALYLYHTESLLFFHYPDRDYSK